MRCVNRVQDFEQYLAHDFTNRQAVSFKLRLGTALAHRCQGRIQFFADAEHQSADLGRRLLIVEHLFASAGKRAYHDHGAGDWEGVLAVVIGRCEDGYDQRRPKRLGVVPWLANGGWLSEPDEAAQL